MPIPFLIGAFAVAAGAFGVKKYCDSRSDNREAERLREKAEEVYEEAQSHLRRAREEAAAALDHLGWIKLNVWNGQMGRFVSLVEKVREVKLEGGVSQDELAVAQFTRQELAQMKQVSLRASEAVSGGATALGSGALAGVASYGGVMMLGTASTGTAITALTGAAATNATLAWLGGGSLAAGGLGVAGGMAVLGGIVAAPVLAIGGIFFASKAQENLANAKSGHAHARRAAEEMNSAASVLNAIQQVAEQYEEAITWADRCMTDVLDGLEQVIYTVQRREEQKLWNRIKRFFGIKVVPNYNNMLDNEKRTLHMAYQLAQVLKILLETPLLKKDGSLAPDCEAVLGNCLQRIEPMEPLLLAAAGRVQ